MSYNHYRGITGEILNALGLRKLPLNLSFPPTQIGNHTVACYPSEGTGRHRPHRLMVICPRCHKEIPVGRYHQHRIRRDHNPFLTK